MNPENPLELSGDASDELLRLPPDISIEVPYQFDVLPDGRDTVVIGDVETLKQYCHRQGENLLDFTQTCGLCSCEGILRRAGIDTTEAEVVAYAKEHELCDLGNELSLWNGGTTSDQQAQILSGMGVPAHWDTGGSVEGLAASLEQGHGLIVSLDAGHLYDESSFRGRGHAVTPIAVARDPRTWEIQGFYVNDTGTGEPGKFVDATTMRNAWMPRGNRYVVTDRPIRATSGGPRNDPAV